MKNRRLLATIGATAATAVLGAPATASATDSKLYWSAAGCTGQIKIWGAGGYVWSTADIAGCNSTAKGKNLVVKIVGGGAIVTSDPAPFYSPIIVIGFPTYEAHAAAGTPYVGGSSYYACASVAGQPGNLGCVTK